MHAPNLTSLPITCSDAFPCVLKYWSSLSLTGTNSTSALDMLENEMVGEIAMELRSVQIELTPTGASLSPPHIHFTRCTALGLGLGLGFRLGLGNTGQSLALF